MAVATPESVVLVDNSNLFIEGQKASAWRKGQRAAADDKQPSDISWRIDFAGLLKGLADKRITQKKDRREGNTLDHVASPFSNRRTMSS